MSVSIVDALNKHVPDTRGRRMTDQEANIGRSNYEKLWITCFKNSRTLLRIL